MQTVDNALNSGLRWPVVSAMGHYPTSATSVQPVQYDNY